MTCMRVGGAVTVPGVWILSGARGRAVSCVTLQSLECRLQIAFGVDQEVGGDHDLLALGDPVQNLDAIAAAATKGDLTRRERSEERRVGKECVSTGRSRWSPSH